MRITVQALVGVSENAMPPDKLERALAPRAAGNDELRLANDGLSFWKLSESLGARLAEAAETLREQAEWYLFEKYLPDSRRRPPSGMNAYYAIKPAIPRWLRHRVNAMVAGLRTRSLLPSWPCDPRLMLLMREWVSESLSALARKDAWHIGFWPDGYDCAIVLTHDVDSLQGFDRMEAMAEIEEKHGFRSAWNLPLAQYPIDWRRVEKLRARGFEFGAHGLDHSGRLFRSRGDFERLRGRVESLARDHDLIGFRSPSTLRRLEWLETLGFDFDSTFADTDPFEPQPGGTCSLLPFFIGRMVELPYTMPQDHTLLNLLRRDPLPVWSEKARWIASLGGMILTLVHPDYSGAPPYLSDYEKLLVMLNRLESAWRALPSEIAAWWRKRARARLVTRSGKPAIVAEDSRGLVVRRVNSERLMKWRTVCPEF